MQTEDPVGIDNEIGHHFKTTLEAVLGDLGHAVERFNDPTHWLKRHTENLAVVAIPRRSPRDVRTVRAAIPGSVIVGARDVTPRPERFRQYLRAGTNGLIAADQPPSDLTNTLAATLTGLIVIPPNVAQALVDRLEEPPPHLDLTERDREILHFITQGTPLKQIAVATGYSDRHLRRITANLLTTIRATNRAHAAALATRWGLN